MAGSRSAAHNAAPMTEARAQGKAAAARDHLERLISVAEENLERLQGKADRWAELAQRVAEDSGRAIDLAQKQLAEWRAQLAKMGG